MMVEKQGRIMGEGVRLQSGDYIQLSALDVPWSVVETAYKNYSALYGTSQSLERLMQRGGFGRSEMDMFCPGWRELSGVEEDPV